MLHSTLTTFSDALANKKTILVSVMTVTLLATANPPTIAEERVGTAQHEIRKGVVINGFQGIVDIVNCTGSMIAPNLVLTAAHCIEGAESTSIGVSNFIINYYSSVLGRDQVFNRIATWHSPLSYDGFRSSRSAAEANDDIAIIQIPGTFSNTDYHDYLRIYADSGNALETYLTAYGAGIFTYSGIGDDNLRKARFEVENIEKNHIKVDTHDGVTLCRGDSGGPLIYTANKSGIKIPTITGVLSNGNFDASDGEFCVNGTFHDNAYYARVTPKRIKWIESVTGVNCTLYKSASKKYWRCFELPFIEDIAYEGSDRDKSVSIAVSSIL